MLRQLVYLFLPYRSFFSPFLALSAIVAPCWLVFRLYWHRSRRRPVSIPREILLLVFVFYLCGLATATLTPNRSTRLVAEGRGGVELRPNLQALTCSSASLRPGSPEEAFCIQNARGNVMLFFPLGILIPLVWMNLRFPKQLLIVLALSFSIELLQYLSSAWGSYRSADVNDFILNVSGGSLGLALASLLRSRPERGPAPQGA